VQNTERLTENLSVLADSYKKAHLLVKLGVMKPEEMTEICQNQAEFIAYFLIATSQSICGLKELMDQRTHLLSQEDKLVIGQALKIKETI
jgi:hypothetical protein